MGNLFNMDNKFFQFMGKVADLMILNILTILCSIPIFTIGASVTALNYVTMKMVRDEEAYIAKGYFRAFKENFKKSTLIWLIALASLIVLVLDFDIMSQMSGTMATVVRYGLWLIALIYAMILLYVFPLTAKFENTIKNTIRNAFLMSIRHLPRTIAMLAIWIIPVLLTFTVAEVLVYGSLVWIMFGFALIAFINAQFFVRIFDNYIPDEPEETVEEPELPDGYEEIQGVTPIWGRMGTAETAETGEAAPAADPADNSDSADA